jgi:hypothetical protein
MMQEAMAGQGPPVTDERIAVELASRLGTPDER